MFSFSETQRCVFANHITGWFSVNKCRYKCIHSLNKYIFLVSKTRSFSSFIAIIPFSFFFYDPQTKKKHKQTKFPHQQNLQKLNPAFMRFAKIPLGGAKAMVLFILTAGCLDFGGCVQHEWSLGLSGTGRALWGVSEHLSSRSEALRENREVPLCSPLCSGFPATEAAGWKR